MMLGFGPRYAKSPNVYVDTEQVVKKIPLPYFDRELRLTELGHSLGHQYGLFRVPSILSWDRHAGVVVFERIADLTTVGQHLAKYPQDCSLIERAGRALSCIHQHLGVPDALRRLASPKWLISPTEIVPIHGDFNTMNVGHMRQTDQLVILVPFPVSEFRGFHAL